MSAGQRRLVMILSKSFPKHKPPVSREKRRSRRPCRMPGEFHQRRRKGIYDVRDCAATLMQLKSRLRSGRPFQCFLRRFAAGAVRCLSAK